MKERNKGTKERKKKERKEPRTKECKKERKEARKKERKKEPRKKGRKKDVSLLSGHGTPRISKSHMDWPGNETGPPR